MAGDPKPKRALRAELPLEELLGNLLVGTVGSFAQQGIPLDILKRVVFDTVGADDFWQAMAEAAEDPEPEAVGS